MSAWSNSTLPIDRHVRQVVDELRPLVEEGAVVLVALDHEVRPAAEAVAALEVDRHAADRNDGSSPASWSRKARRLVVVVFPCVPATTSEVRGRRNSSASEAGQAGDSAAGGRARPRPRGCRARARCR